MYGAIAFRKRANGGYVIYGGVRYGRNQRKRLQQFLSDGRLLLDNSISERELRR